MVLAWIGQDLWGLRSAKTGGEIPKKPENQRQHRRDNLHQHRHHRVGDKQTRHSDNNSGTRNVPGHPSHQSKGKSLRRTGGDGTKDTNKRSRRTLLLDRDVDANNGNDEINSRSEKVLYAILTLVTFLCYWNSLRGDFVHDDVVAVCGNSDVLRQTPLTDLFRNDFWGKPMADPRSHKSYRPLTVLSFRLNYALRGGEDSWDFHLVNLLLHLIVTLLLTFLCRRILQMDRECSFTAAFLFAVHPIHTEAVSGIVGRAEVLSGCFYFLGLIAFSRSLLLKEDCKICVELLITVVSSALALLAKEQGVTVLGVCIVYFVLVPINKSSHYSVPRSWLDKRLLTVAATLACLLAFRVWMLSGSLPQFSDQDNPAACSPYILTRFLTYSYLVFFNLQLLLSPIFLSYDWQMGSIPLVETVGDARNLPTLLATLALLALIWRSSKVSKLRNRRALVLSLATLILPFLPASNLFFTVGFVVAERVLYIPSAGFCILVSYGLDRLREQGWRIAWIGRLSVYVLLFFFIIRTIRRNQDWASREALFLSGIKTVPQNAKVHYNYANLQKDLGNFQLADHHYRIAIALWPDHASAHNNLGTVLNSPEQAEKHFKLALSINPQHARAYFNLASLYSKQGQLELPVALLHHSVDFEPDFAEAFSSLALLYAEMGDHKQAEKYYKKAINLDNDSADYLNNFGIFLQKMGRIEEAVSQYQKAIKVQPNHTAALVNAARTLKSLKNSLEAENLYQRALAIQEDPQIMDNLGVLYLSSGRITDAKRLYNTLMEKFPDHQDAKCRFAQVLIQERSFDHAESILVNLTYSNSSHREALHQMAVLHTAKNQTTEALDYILRALTLCPLTEKTCAQLHVKHGDILRDLNALDEAAESYLLAISLESSITHAHLNLAVIRHLQGNYAEALVHYQEATILDPQNKLVRENKEKLQRTIFRTSRSCNSVQANACRRW